MQDQIHEKHLAWIEARGISAELAVKLGLKTTRDAAGFWLSVPYVERGTTINHKHRMISEKRHRMDPDAPLCLWNHDVLLAPEVRDARYPVIITEGEWDALAAMTAGNRFVLSVPNGAPAEATKNMADPEVRRYQFLWRSRDLLDQVASFIIATDGDNPGRVLAADLVRWIGPERCRLVTYPEGCKDLNEVLLAHGEGGLNAVLNNARPYPVRGLYTIDDFPVPPHVEPFNHGVPKLCDMLPVTPGSLTVGTGYAGQGKTSLMVKVIANLIQGGVTVALGSFETQINPILIRKLRAAMSGTAEYGCPIDLADKADQVMRDRLRILSQMAEDDDADMALEDMLDLARTAILRDGAKVIIIDPWNELDHKRNPDETETDYTSRAIRMMKRFARRYDVALWVIAHPAKPQMTGAKLPIPGLYNISGSAHWANKPDYGFVVHRPKKNLPDDHPERNCIDVIVTKVRMGLPGKEGKVTLNYDWRTSTYHEWIDEFADETA